MSAGLDQRIDELLGEQVPDIDDCPVILEMNEETARMVVEALRWSLYGGSEPQGGRRVLLVVLDSITLALAGHECDPRQGAV